ncbi:MAG: phosphatase [Betaproteobacteria bacterium RBG_16_64_9]|nr:MAG: phosphatase [Betaproteobacteria bacterium RBG_16_64_9]
MNCDLHCHSTCSDGLLEPAELARRAHANGVTSLALTDHDEISGLPEAGRTARTLGVHFIPGVEISVSWKDHTVHIVGLGIDATNRALLEGLSRVRGSRRRRGERIATELTRLGIHGSLEGALAYADNPDALGRTHFARFLVERNYARDVRHVFQQYLVRGKPGYVPHQWASLAEAVGWIRTSGGAAVVAHPGRYRLSPQEMRAMLEDFSSAGGTGLEVVTGSHTPRQYGAFARIAREMDFYCSRGSDYHGPGESKVNLGLLPALPADLKPIWQQL